MASKAGSGTFLTEKERQRLVDELQKSGSCSSSTPEVHPSPVPRGVLQDAVETISISNTHTGKSVRAPSNEASVIGDEKEESSTPPPQQEQLRQQADTTTATTTTTNTASSTEEDGARRKTEEGATTVAMSIGSGQTTATTAAVPDVASADAVIVASTGATGATCATATTTASESVESFGTGCLCCGADDDHANLLLCEGCNAEYHTYVRLLLGE
jgi:hypothetical protein